MGQTEFSKQLINAGANQNLISATSTCSPFMFFYKRWKSSIDFFNFLLEKGASLDQRTPKHGNSVLQFLIKNQSFSNIKLILPKIEVNDVNDKWNSALQIAVSVWGHEVVRDLIRLGACVHHVSRKEGFNLLFYTQDASMIELLLDNKVSLNYQVP